MIPVTTFAGKTVAVFGLGGSGLMSALALKAGGAEVIACDDDPKKMAEVAQADQLPADGPPFRAGMFLADAVGGKALVPPAPDFLGVRPGQNLDHMVQSHTKPGLLADAINA